MTINKGFIFNLSRKRKYGIYTFVVSFTSLLICKNNNSFIICRKPRGAPCFGLCSTNSCGGGGGAEFARAANELGKIFRKYLQYIFAVKTMLRYRDWPQ